MLKDVKTNPKTTTKEETVDQMIDRLVNKAHDALCAMDDFDQATVDHIVHQMAIAGLDHHMELAKAAYDETGRGVMEDKAVKNMFATEEIWHTIKHDKTVGIIKDDRERELITVAEPLGILAGVTPVTNPTSTTLFKSLIAVKTRNPIIFAFHPQAQKSSVMAAKVVRDAAIAAGAPEGVIQWIDKPSIDATTALMNHPRVASVLATGGPGMVKAAYSTGKPALGVGPGNGPAYIEKTANIKRAVYDIVLSKTFDNGMVCASENSAIIDKDIYDDVKKEMQDRGVYFVKKADHKALADAMFRPEGGVKGPIAGMSAQKIADLAGIKVPATTKVLAAELTGVGPKYPMSQEKLSPVISVYKSKDHAEAFKLADELLHFGGLGHTAAIHTMDDDLATEYGIKMKASRVLVNTPSALGGIGNLYNEMIPSLTLGTGSWGKNSVSHNVSSFDLLNIKTIAKRRNNMQWIKLPRVYFEKTSVRYLDDMPGIKRVFLVTDPAMVQLGYVDTVLNELKRQPNGMEYSLFSDVEPDPTTDTVNRGVALMRQFKPDTIIALGGGSAMDAAKNMWLFYEDPKASFFGAKQKFLDIRKRAYKFNKPHKAQFVAIPTTSGTGSEVTPFSVITDSKTHVKYPLADYALTPDVAIVDSQFIETVPKKTVAYSGLDVLTHAIESYVSVMASDYTRPWSLQAIKLVMDNLTNSYNGDITARQEMHNASTLAGMAFANAFLGVDHSIAHKLGGEFGLPHGLAIAITLPHVIRYNFKEPTKMSMWPKYEYFRADEDYAQIARYLGLPGNTKEELKEALVKKVIDLAHSVGVTLSLKANGVDKAHFDKTVDHLAELAFEDQCTTANPKEPLVSELKQIMIDEYDGKGVEK
ncbi:bifunctional acetaldehyde-CoA alcohol dehydrogenase [Levilactobacillus namurensis DSM 19117]|uniref:Aldehyde-alcohol dehydrogenase n=2 Tax=Levilactobacillus namurensis TaxID=380393 RepID=A0A0R1JPC5_9LACO|nr:bifunctional acetaldehyde-CoA/alcohol dehydrogenase [Levilactobacillus namurensis]PTM22144.1 bifunctional acetaldehyde-CoA/alcohol dehydrogenase [Lactobacillus sp. PFC-70]KRK73165.1 bifunctional acetaldehyde-CoA alcohol dehydrogenase [Levilactobacillus namurensis DSM 19117]MCW3778339.1 bifunctional acetaldehyde-CoA/alcohol dehydrogenase [Levilactobacillus namurensis]MDT7013516.1 bifunctional acetaldehyde-CoA/alcohol dehydrogenase [Levilactobacillus namurensis]MDT7019673.1 bifunctional aceta